MKNIITLLFVSLLIISTVSADNTATESRYHGHSDIDFRRAGFNCGMDNISIDFEDDILIMTNHHKRDIVEITPNYDLIVNGDKVEIDDHQRGIVKEFYMNMSDLVESAKAVGAAGAKIGIEGASLGLSALGKVFRLLDADYDTDDLEREVEREARAIEKKAESLEKEAEKIEWMADDLEDLYDNMEREIVEIRDLNWD